MDKIYNISIVLSFLGLWLTSTIPAKFEIFLGFILIFSFGILHGSNDIILIDTISNEKTKYPFLKVLAVYLLTVFTSVAFFYFIPIVALILFIVFSAFHFGEQHWESKNLNANKLLVNTFYFFYGLSILFLLFVFNTSEVIEIIDSITKYTFSSESILYCFIFSTIALAFLMIKLLYESKSFQKNIVKELFFLVVFAIVFKVSSLIWGFTIYFIFWHSVPSLFEQVIFIYGSFSKGNLCSYVKKALPYWFISLVGITTVFLIFKEEQLLYAILFSFIAAVTFPHSFVINKMFSNKKTQSNE